LPTPVFEIVYQDETMLLLLDLDLCATITNSAEQVVRTVDELVGGIGINFTAGLSPRTVTEVPIARGLHPLPA